MLFLKDDAIIFQVLMDMFFQDDDSALAGVEEEPIYNRRGSLTYEEICKDLIHEETQYIRDLEMIIKVFRIPFVALFPQSKVKYAYKMYRPSTVCALAFLCYIHKAR